MRMTMPPAMKTASKIFALRLLLSCVGCNTFQTIPFLQRLQARIVCQELLPIVKNELKPGFENGFLHTLWPDLPDMGFNLARYSYRSKCGSSPIYRCGIAFFSCSVVNLALCDLF